MADGFRFPLNIYGHTDVGGKRQRNEDAYRFHLPKTGEAELRLGALALVCDGMGGVGKGDIASQTAVEAIFRVFYDVSYPETDTRARLQKAIETAHAEVQARAREFGMMYIGSTAAGMVVRPDGTAILFNLGDSRIYRKRGESFEVMSKDQSVLAAQLERGEITPEQAQASRNMNITAFIGHPLELDIVFRQVQVEAGDIFLLCSDGLWDVVRDPELKNALDTRSDEAALNYYITETLKRGAPDNVTAIIVSTRQPQSAKFPAWLWGLVGLGVVAVGAFAVMQGSVNTLVNPTASPTAETPVGVVSIATEAETPIASVAVESPTPSETPSREPSATRTPRPSATPTDTATDIPSETPVPSETPTHINTATRRPTRTPTSTPEPSATPSETPTASATFTHTHTATYTPSNTPTHTRTPTFTPTITNTPSAVPTITPRPSLTPRPTRPPTETPTVRPSRTPVPTEFIAATSTFSPVILSASGTPMAELELIEVYRIWSSDTQPQAPIKVYLGDTIQVNAQTIFPEDRPNIGLQLVRLRPGVFDVLTTQGYYYREIKIEPHLIVVIDGGISVRQSDSVESPTVMSVGQGETLKILGKTRNGAWLRVQTRQGPGWVASSLAKDGAIRLRGDIANLDIIVPLSPTPTGDPDATPEASPTEEAPPPPPTEMLLPP